MSLSKPIPEDHDGYNAWGKTLVLTAMNLKLVHEVNKDLCYFPENSTELLKFEVIFWDKETAIQTRKELKDAGMYRPQQLHPSVFLPFNETLAGMELLAEDNQPRTGFRQKAAVYENILIRYKSIR